MIKIKNIINELPFNYQMVIYLTKLEKLSYKETAIIMEKSERQIKTLAHNAKKKLKQLLVKERVIEMKNNKIVRLLSIILVVGIFMTGVVFAKEIKNFVKNLFGANSSEGIGVAVENGYETKIENEYQEADGIQIGVNSFLIDDYNFAMNFDVSLADKYDAQYFYEHWLDFNDLIITDEMDNIVFCSRDYKFEDEGLKEKSYNGAYSFLPEKIGDKNLKVSLVATGNQEKFPRSKHLSIKLTKIRTTQIDEEKQSETNTFYKGDWSFEVDVPEEMYNRENIIYKAESCNDDSIKLEQIQASVSNTALKINIPVVTTDKIDYELLHSDKPKSIYDKIALQKEYVETSDGKKFETAQRSDGDGGYSILEDGKILNYYQTFNLTKYDATDKIVLHIFTNKNEEIIINLKSDNIK